MTRHLIDKKGSVYMMSGGKLLVKCLAAHGAEKAFCVAGESYLPVLDGFLDFPDIDVVTCRHESSATFMAEAYANLTGKPGVALATRGPGACNASIGIHAARQSSTPVIFLVGLVNTSDLDKEAFQEFDIEQMFGSLAKWSTVIHKTERIPEYIARAFHVARSGKPGPVVLGLPEDVLFADIKDLPAHTIPQVQVTPSDQDIGRIKEMLAGAQRPLVVVGGSWNDRAYDDLAAFVSQNHLPVAAAFRRHDAFSHEDGNYIGELGTGANPKLIERAGKADVLLVLGARLDEITTQSYTLIQGGQKIIHIHPGESVFGQSYIPDLAVQADYEPLAAALAAKCRLDGRSWAAWRDEGRQEYIEWSSIADEQPNWNGADMTQVFRQLGELLPKDAIVTTDAGNFSGWCQRYLRYGRPGRSIGPISGAMGYGVPSAIAASLAYPDRVVLGVCGDGGFMMTGQELATAVHHGAKPVIMVCNNSMYGTIRMHQEKTYPGRISATGLSNPDFVKFGESFGAFAARVERAADFTDIWRSALDSGRPALIEIAMDPRQITTRAAL